MSSTLTHVKLSYCVVEPAEKKDLTDVILIHGITSCKETWDDIAKTLANGSHRRVYAIDVRNHGDSPWDNEFNYEVMANDVLRFMDDLGIQKAIFIGHSMGGKISMVAAVSEPERVERLVVEDFTPKSLPDDQITLTCSLIGLQMKAIEAVPPNVDLETAQEALIKFVYENMPKEYAISPERREKSPKLPIVKKDGRYVWKTNFGVIAGVLKNPKMKEDVEGVYKKPALFVYGTRSPYGIHKDEEYILKVFPKAQLYPIEGATHLVHMEHPKEFCQVVLDFLNDF